MSKRILKFLFVLIVFCCCVSVANAKIYIDDSDYIKTSGLNYGGASVTNVTVQGSIMTITSSGNVSAYYVGTENNYSKATSYSSSSNTYHVSVKNGTYYVWVQDRNSAATGSVAPIKYKNPVTVTTSCSNDNFSGVSGAKDVNRCGVYDVATGKYNYETGNFSCAAGQTIVAKEVITNNCAQGKMSFAFAGQRLEKQIYCKLTYRITCGTGGGQTPVNPAPNPPAPNPGPSVAAATLSSLSVNPGSLNFNGSKTYNVSVGADVGSIHVSAYSNNGTVINGNEQDFALNYGNNKIYIKVKNSAGNINTYTIIVNRDDSRSQINTLSNLTTSIGTLSPAFSSENTTYSLTLPYGTKSIDVNAVLTDGSAHFEEGFGPRTVNVDEGNNIIDVRVTSARGNTLYYTINAYVDTYDASSCGEDRDSKALLKSFKFLFDDEDYDYDLAPEFKEDVFSYTAKVPYKITNLIVDPKTKEEGDVAEVLGGSNLEVNIEQEVSIKVKSKTCPNIERVYHIGVTRLPEQQLSSNPEIDTMTIDNHNEFKFEQNTEMYDLKLHKGESSLVFNVKTEDDGTSCIFEGNENLTAGSKIKIECTSEDGENTATYTINITGVEKGTNIFLIIIIIIIVIFIIIYLILRLLGYKIYFNFEVIGAFFRGIGEKITNIFDK